MMRTFYLGIAAVSVTVVALATLAGWLLEQATAGAVAGIVLMGAGLPACLGWKLHRELDVRYRRLEAWISTYAVIRPRVPLPWPRPYMASPELLRIVTQLVAQHRPRLVLELGSGVSSLVAAYALDGSQKGHLVSVDHEARFSETTRALIAEHGLEARCTVTHAPLVALESEGHGSSWYDPNVLDRILEERGSVDLLIVDGPPGGDQPMARRPAFYQLQAKLAAGAVILVDDARRKDEQEMVRQWVRACPELSAEYLDTEKGTFVLKLGRADSMPKTAA